MRCTDFIWRVQRVLTNDSPLWTPSQSIHRTFCHFCPRTVEVIANTVEHMRTSFASSIFYLTWLWNSTFFLFIDSLFLFIYFIVWLNLSIHLLMDIWVSIFLLLCVKQLWTFMYLLIFGQVFSFLLGKYLEVRLLGHTFF